MKILNGNKLQILHARAIIDQIAANYFESMGQTVITLPNGAKTVIGKIVSTGQDDPEAVTTTWAIEQQAPDGSWYIDSPSNDPRFYLWRDYLQGMVIEAQEIDLPVEWQTFSQG